MKAIIVDEDSDSSSTSVIEDSETNLINLEMEQDEPEYEFEINTRINLKEFRAKRDKIKKKISENVSNYDFDDVTGKI